jgi:hypothetical protein
MRLLAVSIYHTELLLPDDVPPLVPNSGMYCACPLVEGVRAGVWAEAITAGMARLAARIPRAFMTISSWLDWKAQFGSRAVNFNAGVERIGRQRHKDGRLLTRF